MVAAREARDYPSGMDISANCPLAGTLAARLRASRDELTARWLERITDRVNLEPDRIFPTDELLDHVPLLVLGIADYIENPARVVSADPPIIAKAMELGALRHAQGFDEYEILKEYEIFGGILYSFLARIVDQIEEECSRSELLVCAHRLFHAISLIQQATNTEYVQLMKERLREREDRLRTFNRALTHEFRNLIGAALGAAQVMDLPGLEEERRQRLKGVIIRNIRSMNDTLENLLELTRLSGDSRRHRHVLLSEATAEVMRQLREFANEQGVELRIHSSLPRVEVAAAGVELVLTNLVSNAIKYHDPAKAERWVEVGGRLNPDGEPCEAVVEVRDNGLGVPPAVRSRLFERFFRAHEHSATHVQGTGLGLSIVRDAVQSLGGRVWAEFPEQGSVFAFTLPCRRASDTPVVVEREAAARQRA